MMTTTMTNFKQGMGGASLVQVVQAICDSHGGGQATLVRATGFVRVIDCPAWTTRASAALRLQRPAALLAVEPSTASLSGFAVSVSEPPPPMQRVPRLLTLAVGMALFVVAQRTLAHLAGDSSLCASRHIIELVWGKRN
jgi:hypothetical protein